MARRADHVWADRRQAHLLRAAFLDGPAAVSAFDRWAAETDLDDVDIVSQRLLPLLFRNLTRLGVGSSLMPRLQGLYRQTWYRNQLLIGSMSRVIEALRGREIEAVILKGVALAILHYRDPGVRPMEDADLLVPLARYRDAVDTLGALGWRAKGEPDRWPPRHQPGWAFVDARGFELDLHAHLLLEGLHPGAGDAVWTRTRPIRLKDVTGRALGTADQLFHVIAHGVRWNAFPSARWIADAAVVIRDSEDMLEWEVFADEARRWRLTCTVRAALSHLRSTLGVAIPLAAETRLGTARVSWSERLEHRTKLQDHTGPLGTVPSRWFLYIRWCRGHRRRPGLLGFLRYLGDVWGIGHAELPRTLVAKAARRSWHPIRRAIGTRMHAVRDGRGSTGGSAVP